MFRRSSISAIPAIFFIGILALLAQRRVRVSYRVSRDDGSDADLDLDLGDDAEEDHA